jgi:hypothetical protein
MLPFMEIQSDDEERYIYFQVATGTRPYATHWMVFDSVTSQWWLWRIDGGSGSMGIIQNQFGKRKVVYGTVTGDIFQVGERSDQSLGAYTNTLSGIADTFGGNSLSDASATFNATELPGAPMLVEDADDSNNINYRGFVLSVPTTSTLKTFPATSSTVTGDADNFYLGGIEAYWTSKETALGDPNQQKEVRFIDIQYEVESAGALEVHYKVDNGSWTATTPTTVDLTASPGSERLLVQDVGTWWQFRVRLNQTGRGWHVTSFVVEGEVIEEVR